MSELQVISNLVVEPSNSVAESLTYQSSSAYISRIISPCTGWGEWWVNCWGNVAAKWRNNRAASSYQQAKNLQLHFKKLMVRVQYTLCTLHSCCSEFVNMQWWNNDNVNPPQPILPAWDGVDTGCIADFKKLMVRVQYTLCTLHSCCSEFVNMQWWNNDSVNPPQPILPAWDGVDTGWIAGGKWLLRGASNGLQVQSLNKGETAASFQKSSW